MAEQLNEDKKKILTKHLMKHAQGGKHTLLKLVLVKFHEHEKQSKLVRDI
jgi:hypothetical protein